MVVRRAIRPTVTNLASNYAVNEVEAIDVYDRIVVWTGTETND